MERVLVASTLIGAVLLKDVEADGGWYAYSKPVIIRGLTRNEQFRALCSKQRHLQEFGNRLVRLSTANTYYQKVDVLFKDYVKRIMKPQSLDSLGSDNNFTEWDSLFRTYIQPPIQLPGTKGAYSFGIAVCCGQHWLLYPPDKTEFHPNRTTLSWILDTYLYLSEEDKPLECTIHPGEILYFQPSNSAASIGISVNGTVKGHIPHLSGIHS